MQHTTKQTEEELMALVANGNQQAFKQIYKMYYPKLYAYTLKFIKSPELAEDIVQDVFLKIWENRCYLKNVITLGGYLYTISKNMTLNMLARAAREKKIKDLIVASAQQHHSETENTVLQKEYGKLLQMAIEDLPAQRRKVFRMCKIEGKSYEEVADILGIGVGTVNDHIVKATRRMRKFLKQYDINFNQ